MPTLEIIITSQLLIVSVAIILFYRARYLDMVDEARRNSDGWREAVCLAKEIHESNKVLVEMINRTAVEKYIEAEQNDNETPDSSTHTSQ